MTELAPSSASTSTSPSTPSPILHDLSDRFYTNAKRTRHMFLSNYATSAGIVPTAESLRLSTKISDEYAEVKHLATTAPASTANKTAVKSASIASTTSAKRAAKAATSVTVEDDTEDEKTTINEPSTSQLVQEIDTSTSARLSTSTALTLHSSANDTTRGTSSALILRERARQQIKPQWHAPWKLMRVLAGHTGWVRCLAVDPANEWFATGSNDRTIKIWDLASGTLKLSLTGHISAVRGLAVSARHPYLFSVGEDKTVKCWDLEQNKSIRNYHGHLSGVYTCSLHPSLDILITGGRDATARVWDIRTRAQVAVLSGHTATVGSIATQEAAPQVVTGSHDSQIKLWDLTAAKAYATLTHHKKSVRALRIHPNEYTFASGAADNLKVWKCPEGTFLRNITGHNTIVNAMAINRENVLISGGDNGSLYCYDWKTGYNFQQITTPAQPGSLDSECGIFAMDFDMSGSRLITAEADKSIKIYREDESATPESHPIDFKPKKRKRF